MSLLDIFAIKFTADTDELEKAAKQYEGTADDFMSNINSMSKEADKAMDSAGKSAQKTAKSMGKTGDAAADAAHEIAEVGKKSKGTSGDLADMAKAGLASVAAFMGLDAAIGAFLGTAEEVKQLQQTAGALGMPVEEVDAFSKVAIALGHDAKDARDSLTDMAEAIGEAIQDPESMKAETFAGLGIQLKDVEGNAKDAVSGMLELSEAVEGLSREEAIFRIKELGITDNRTVELVLKGRKELERMIKAQKESGVVTTEQAEVIGKFSTALNVLKSSVSTTATGFTAMFVPAMTMAVEWLTDLSNWMSENKDFVVGFFAAITAAILYAYLPAITAAAVATATAVAPFLAIGAAIAAVGFIFAAVYDDVMNFIEGNDSLIGQILEKFPLLKDMAYAVADAFKAVAQWISAMFDAVATKIGTIFGYFSKGLGMIKSGIGSLFGSDEEAMAGVRDGQQQLATASASPLNSVTSNSIQNSVANSSKTSNVTVGEVNVQTQATDSEGISRDIGNDLSSQLRGLDEEFSTGVER